MKQRISIKDSFQIDSQYNLVRLSTRKIAPILAPILAPMYSIHRCKGVSTVQFCTTGRPQLLEFEVPSCRTSSLRSKKAILEDGTSNLQK